MTSQASPGYDLILVGSGFASSMFLYEYLRRAKPDARVLVLERGPLESHGWQLEHRRELGRRHESSFVNRGPKPWIFRLAFGGASNCWWACVPRMLPEDFELATRYGVGSDWPVSYDQLEEHYCLAEEIMGVSGPSEDSPFPRSRPYPQAPHKLSTADEVLKAAYPDRFFAQPAARPRQTTAGGRTGCCASGVCHLCPVDSKFTITNGMHEVYGDPRVELELSALAERVEIAGGVAQGVHYRRDGSERYARAEVVGLGANALFNPHLLLRSGLDGPACGRGLGEQLSVEVDVDLDGLDNLHGSTVITGHGYMLYSGPHRRRRAAALMETFNRQELRDERGKWHQRLSLKLIFEDLRQDENRVQLGAADDPRPEVIFNGYSPYALAALRELPGVIGDVLSPLPVEDIRLNMPNPTESHILGTAIMGRDPETSVVDGDLIHHRVRNLLVLGGSAFPTAPPANPTLTISALSLRAARQVFG